MQLSVRRKGAAIRADGEIGSGQAAVTLAIVFDRRRFWLDGRQWDAAQRELGGAMAVGKEPTGRMRWKPSGTTCSKDRRMNSSAAGVITSVLRSCR